MELVLIMARLKQGLELGYSGVQMMNGNVKRAVPNLICFADKLI